MWGTKNHHFHDFGILGRVQTPPKPTLFFFLDTRTLKSNQEKSLDHFRRYFFVKLATIFGGFWKYRDRVSFFRFVLLLGRAPHALSKLAKMRIGRWYKMVKYNLKHFGYEFHMYQKQEMEIWYLLNFQVRESPTPPQHSGSHPCTRLPAQKGNKIYVRDIHERVWRSKLEMKNAPWETKWTNSDADIGAMIFRCLKEQIPTKPTTSQRLPTTKENWFSRVSRITKYGSVWVVRGRLPNKSSDRKKHFRFGHAFCK